MKPKTPLDINCVESSKLLKMRFLITFNSDCFQNYKGDFNYKVEYNIKKTIKDIINFNTTMIKTISEKIKVSPILLHYKTIN